MAREPAAIKKLRERPWLWALPVFAFGIALAFGPSWGAPTFLARDDSILRLPLLSNWRNVPIIFSRDFMPFSDGMYRPFSYALVAILRSAVSADAFVFWHTMLLAVHMLNAAMVFLLTRELTKHTGASLLAAGVFCFHPLSFVLVNDINNLHLLLGLSSYLGTALLYLAFRRSRRVPYFAFAFITFALGLLTSTVIITLPLLLIVYECVYQRLRKPGMMLAIGALLLLGLSAMVVWARMKPPPLLYSYPVGRGDAVPSFLSLVAGARCYVLGLLLGWRVPVVLRDLLPLVSSWTDPSFLVGAGVIVLLLAVAFWRMARRDAAGLGLCFMCATMIPFATTAWNPVEAHGSWVYLYGAMAGLAVAAGGLAKQAFSMRVPWLRRGIPAALILLVVHNGIRLSLLNRAARSPVTFWQSVLTWNERSKTAQIELGKAYLTAGEPDKAVKHLFTPAVDSLDESCVSLCRYYFRDGNLWAASIHAMFAKDDLAIAELWEALNCLDHAECRVGVVLSRNPCDTQALKLLARVFRKKGFLPDARRVIAQVADIDPSDTEARSMLAELDRDEPRAHTAVPARGDWVRFMVDRTFSDALHRRTLALAEALPNDPVIRMTSIGCLLEQKKIEAVVATFMNAYSSLCAQPRLGVQLAWYLTQSGRHKAGEAIAREVLCWHPDNARMQSVLGMALAKQGRFEDAIPHLTEALRLNPNTAATHYHMGWALAGLGKPDDAVDCFNRAIQINPDLVEAHLGLANAYTALGEKDRAAKHIAEAIRAKQNDPKAHREWAVASFLKKDYATAWKHVRECQKRGGWLHPDFLWELRAKMPPPNNPSQ